MGNHYHSNGKLLLTGEYLVLQGAQALALPVKRGQHLHVFPLNKPGIIHWKSSYLNTLFFEAQFIIQEKKVTVNSDSDPSKFLQNLLQHALDMAPDAFSNQGYRIETMLEFPLEWGLGSSSSLISNIAEWLQIDAFKLNHQVNQGSGYDIACAKSHRPILYKKLNGSVHYEPISFNPPFQDSLYFIYTGKKQDSHKEVKKFLKGNNVKPPLTEHIKRINKEILHTRSLEAFAQHLREHELLISKTLNKKPIQENQFPDFPGTIKSLGAWGGDFILAATHIPWDELKDYFQRHNMNTLFTWGELIKT